MRRPSSRLIITFLISIVLGYGLSWAIMVGLDAPFRFYGFGNLTAVAVLLAALVVIMLDGPLNLGTFDWPTAEEEPGQDKNTRDFFIVGVLVLLVTAVTIGGYRGIRLLPVQASWEAISVDWLLNLHFQLIAFFFALVVVFIVYSVIVFRRKPGDTGDGDYFHGHTSLEIVWTIIPLGLVIYLGFLGVRELNRITAPKPNELVVEVTASQWAWRFDYPEQGISSTTLGLPRGRPILLRMVSPDVIHSFWVPEFRVKQDVVPGHTTELRITPTLVGEYKVRCAELCGRQHSTMLASVAVLEAEDFDAWVESAKALASGGASVAQVNGCLGCHSVDGSKLVGPSWLGLFGKQEQLTDGSTVTVDEAYLRDSILNPNAKIVQGFPANVMPANYGETLSDEEIQALIDFIKELGN